jgi:hypothetical protein
MITVYFPYDEDLYSLDELDVIYDYKDILERKIIPFAFAYYDISDKDRKLSIILHKNPAFFKDAPILGRFTSKNDNPVMDIYALDYMSTTESIKVFFHEFTHYKQWLFKEEKLKDDYKLNYMERPWEIEAWKNQELMFEYLTMIYDTTHEGFDYDKNAERV